MTTPWRLRVEKDFGISNGDWSNIKYDEIDWRHWSDEEKRDLWAEINSGILNVVLHNGVEARTVIAHPKHPHVAENPYLRWLATEAQLGELEAEVMTLSSGTWPPSPVEEWQEVRDELEAALNDIKQNPTNPTKGDEALSQEAHAALALSALQRLSDMEAFYIAEAGHDASLVREAIATAAHLGFAAGQHAYSSIMKPFERNAVTGGKVNPHLDRRREFQNREMQRAVAARRLRIEALLQTTSLKKGALRKWLTATLSEEGFDKVSKSTIYADLKTIRKNHSSTS